jgi:hypothetical protein
VQKCHRALRNGAGFFMSATRLPGGELADSRDITAACADIAALVKLLPAVSYGLKHRRDIGSMKGARDAERPAHGSERKVFRERMACLPITI